MTTVSKLKGMFRDRNYILNDRPFELNILGERSAETKANAFDDLLHVFHRNGTGKGWQGHSFRITTDPGTYWLRNPMMPQGTAILAAGQYVHGYEIGSHRGIYDALVQKDTVPVTVIRDYDRDAVLDFNNGRKGTAYGINIHRAHGSGATLRVDTFSAGCQVFRENGDFVRFMKMCGVHAGLYGNSFTYSLVDHRARKRLYRKRGLWIGSAVLGTGLAVFNARKMIVQ